MQDAQEGHGHGAGGGGSGIVQGSGTGGGGSAVEVALPDEKGQRARAALLLYALVSSRQGLERVIPPKRSKDPWHGWGPQGYLLLKRPRDSKHTYVAECQRCFKLDSYANGSTNLVTHYSSNFTPAKDGALGVAVHAAAQAHDKAISSGQAASWPIMRSLNGSIKTQTDMAIVRMMYGSQHVLPLTFVEESLFRKCIEIASSVTTPSSRVSMCVETLKTHLRPM